MRTVKRTAVRRHNAMTSGFALIWALTTIGAGAAEPLAGTAPLDWEGDVASRMIDAV